jgi:hypothetical protein
MMPEPRHDAVGVDDDVSVEVGVAVMDDDAVALLEGVSERVGVLLLGVLLGVALGGWTTERTLSRRREDEYSDTYRLPAESSARPSGLFRLALVAAPPRPLVPVAPFPAIVIMVPVPAVIMRTRWLSKSANSRSP